MKLKKVCMIFILILIFLLLYLLHSNFFIWFNIAGIMPNLFVILVLFVGLFLGRKEGIFLGVFFGIFLDLLIGRRIGICALMFGLVGFFGGYLDKNFSKESRITLMVMVMGVTAFYEIGTYILNAFFLSTLVEIWTFIRILAIEVIFNIFLTIILYPLIQKMGFYMEKIFKGNKILTRYY